MKIVLKGFLSFIVCFAWTVFLFAQQVDPISLTNYPVPEWPQGGIDPAATEMPPEFSEDYVFVDVNNNEYVVAYPIILEESEEQAQVQEQGQAQRRGRGRGNQPQQEEDRVVELKEKSKPLKIERYELLRDVAPDVTVAITNSDIGKVRYAYTIVNAPSARQSIDQWALVLPAEAGSASISNPLGWFSVVQGERNFKLKNPDWTPNGAGAIWSYQNPDQVIEPGDLAAGFEIESKLLPGFTIGFFRQAESTGVKVATSGNVPEVVKDQLDRLLVLEYNSKTLLLLGPKFDKDTPMDVIAKDFIQGIFTMSRLGLLDLGSEFIRATINELTGIQPSGGAVRLTPLPTNRIEKAILNALEISLRTKSPQ